MSVIIDLRQTDTKAFKSQNLIQFSAKASFSELINNFIKDIENNKSIKKNRIDRVHNTILINGKRGMGKTSFILSIEEDQDILLDICSLGIIDPTLIETKENVFLNIITLIKEQVDKAIQSNKCEYVDSKYKTWKDSLKNLAGGLSMLEGVGSNHLKDGMWDSPELVMEKGLSNSKQGYKLENNFHIFIDASLNLLDKKAFFLILDDIDTSLKEGRDLLETLRKYLTSRKLIMAMLGDIDLYSTLVRQLQWEKMDPNGTLQKYEGSNKYIGQIEHLEEQYLTKVLKPENRIDLQNLLKLRETLEILKKDNTIESFNEFIENMISNIYLTKDSVEKRYYQNTLLTQSTRSVLQLLQSWDNAQRKDDFIISLKHTFYTTIKKKLEAYNLIELISEDNFLNLLSIYIIKENIGIDNHIKLVPQFMKEDDNITMLYINAMANNILHPKDYLSYFIKVCYATEIFQKHHELDKKDKNQVEGFIESCLLDSKASLEEISTKLLTKFDDISPGNVAKSNYKIFGNIFIKGNILENEESIAFLIQTIQKPKTYNFISFFKLLSNIAENSSKQSDLDDWSQKAKDISRIPLFVLSKIWIRFAETIYVIEERSENNNKDYADIFSLYIAGFLNAIYVETELYFGNKNVNTNNVSTSTDAFTKKIEKRNEERQKEDKKEYIYTLFDYVYACPILNDINKNLNQLRNIFAAKNNKKIDFSQLEHEEQKSILENFIIENHLIDELTKYKELSSTDRNNFISNKIRNKLSQYQNVRKVKFEQLLAEYIK